jgi:AraC-like DNA-binding protein
MKISEEEVRFLLSIQKLRNSEIDLRRIPMAVEEQLHQKILQGDYKNIELQPFPLLDDKMGLMAKNPLTHYSYMVVAFISAWARLVLTQGVTADDSFDLSDALLYTLSCCTSLDEVHEVFVLSATMYAKAVFEAKQKQPSYQVVQIQNYVIANIYRKITIQDIANYIQLSPNYLCNLFSHEMQLSLHNYIQREKVRVACDLLRHTKRPVADVATYMGFQTQSHFAAVFRKWMNMTPTAYREAQYREVF